MKMMKDQKQREVSMHCEQQLQQHLPGLDFWDYSDHGEFTRKITLEFFTMQRIRVFLRGDPPFRETCQRDATDSPIQQ